MEIADNEVKMLGTLEQLNCENVIKFIKSFFVKEEIYLFL